MVLCLLASFQGVIKLLHLLQQVIKSSTLYMLALEMSIIPHVEHMALDSCHVPFFLFRKVHAHCFFYCLLILSSIQASESKQKTIAFQQFCCQLYHSCLTYVYSPLRPVMTTPEIMQCPDGHFHQCVFSIRPYIADYPEQVWLACIIGNWCPK
jgi:Plavaka transposase